MDSSNNLTPLIIGLEPVLVTTDIAIRVRDQLASHKITDQNFQQFKHSLFAAEYKRRYEPSPPLNRRKF